MMTRDSLSIAFAPTGKSVRLCVARMYRGVYFYVVVPGLIAVAGRLSYESMARYAVSALAIVATVLA